LRKNAGKTTVIPPDSTFIALQPFTRHFVFGREMQKITLWDKIRNPVFKG